MINILVACGSGVATSTLAADEVKSVWVMTPTY